MVLGVTNDTHFSVSCCLHWEHCVNPGMCRRSDCRGRTTSHCCYCYYYLLLRQVQASLVHLGVLVVPVVMKSLLVQVGQVLQMVHENLVLQECQDCQPLL